STHVSCNHYTLCWGRCLMPNPTTFAVTRTPIADPKTGMATWTFIKKLQEYETKLTNAITLLGEIAAAANIEGRTEGIGTTVTKLNSSGLLLDADQVAGDGSTFGRTNITALNAGDVDLSKSGVTNKNAANIAETSNLKYRTGAHSTYRPTSNPLTATDAGATATVNIASFTMRVAGNDVSISSGSVTGLSFDTLYYIYYDDPNLAGGAVTYASTTTKEDALDNSGRFFVGSILTPVNGAFGTEGNTDGGGGAQSGLIIASRPTADSAISGGGWASPTNAYDRKADTFSSGVADVNGADLQHRWETFSLPAEGAAATEEMTIEVITEFIQTGNPTGETGYVRYSTNSGSSWTNFYTTSGSRTLGRNTASLPKGQNLLEVLVEARAAITTGDGSNKLEGRVHLIRVKAALQ
ncbi:hypothetical protein LCGC14_2390690, partial [marine sediment metagenome]